MNFLDAAIEETQARNTGPRIVRENHDFNNIRIQGAPEELTDAQKQDRIQSLVTPRGWDAGEMGMTLAQATAMVERQTSPEARAKAIADLKKRAVERAGLATKDGKVLVVSAVEDMWHDMGIVAEGRDESGRLTADEIRILDVLNVEAAHAPMYIKVGDDFIEVPEMRGIYRTDTLQPFSCAVKGRHEIVQHTEGLNFVESILGEFGAHFETAGVLGLGETAFVTAKLPDSFEAIPGDWNHLYLSWYSRNDGMGSNVLFRTGERPVCRNTMRLALQKNGSQGFRFSHTKNIRQKMDDARRMIAQSQRDFAQYAENCKTMAQTPIGNPVTFFEGLLDMVVSETKATYATSEEVKLGADALSAAVEATERDKAFKQWERKIRTREKFTGELLELYSNDKNAGLVGDTVWAGLNAVTEHADHHTRYTGQDEVKKEERRQQDILNGRADELKQVAYNFAVASLN